MEDVAFKFPMIPASKRSLSQRKLVFGVGVNDAEYKTYTRIEGKVKSCPYYSRWRDMLTRCYSRKYLEKYPTYKNCGVCEKWLIFSNFRNWMEKQDWKDKHLDKDLILPNNKVYSPETCVFVSNKTNCLLLDCGKLKGKCKQGVCLYKDSGKFLASCSNGKGIRQHLGLFPTESQAYEAYVTYKHALILKVAAEQEDIRVKKGLLLHADILLDTLDGE